MNICISKKYYNIFLKFLFCFYRFPQLTFAAELYNLYDCETVMLDLYCGGYQIL